jgi:hypothetical protein
LKRHDEKWISVGFSPRQNFPSSVWRRLCPIFWGKEFSGFQLPLYYYQVKIWTRQ